MPSVFLGNSELWTLTKKLENIIDIFQCRHLRKILGIKWQRNITNNELYTRTKCELWTKLIKIRSLTSLGHMMRLHPETLVRNVFEEYLRKVKRPQGRSKTTCMQTMWQDLGKIWIKLDLSSATRTLNKLFELTQSRAHWSNIIKTRRAITIGCDIIVVVRRFPKQWNFISLNIRFWQGLKPHSLSSGSSSAVKGRTNFSSHIIKFSLNHNSKKRIEIMNSRANPHWTRTRFELWFHLLSSWNKQ